MPDPEHYAFEDVVAAHTGADFVQRDWLLARIEAGLDEELCRYVLLVAEPGAGKTGLLAAVAAAHPERPRWFTRLNSASPLAADGARSFLLSLGHQLARARPDLFPPVQVATGILQEIGRIAPGGRVVGVEVDELLVSPFAATAIGLRQEVRRVQGDLVGMSVRHAVVDEHLLPVDVLYELALREPATRLAAIAPSERLTVLVDGLDEIADGENAGILDWLESGPRLPDNVRLVLTSREFPRLHRFRLRRLDQLTELGIDPRSAEVRDDLAAFAARILGGGDTEQVVERQGSTVDALVDEVADRAQGNFAYLAAYNRALADAVRRGETSLRDRLLRLSDVPVGPDGLYDLFMATVHQDISNLGMIDVAHPISETDIAVPAWEHVGQAVLGILAVAREPLTEAQIARLSRVRVWERDVVNVVDRLSPYLDRSMRGYSLFHPSFATYLTGDELRARRRAWAVDPSEWHEKIVRCARRQNTEWSEVNWSDAEPYVVRHVASHLSRCRARLADELPDLVTPALRAAQRAITGTDRAFLTVIDLAEERAAHDLPPERAIPTAVLLGAVARQMQGVDTVVPSALVGVLVRLGRLDEALDLVSAQPPSLGRVKGLAAVLNQAPDGLLDDARRRDLLTRLVQDAREVPLSRSWGGSDPSRRREALAEAAVLVGPYRPNQALHLVREAGPTTGWHSGEDESIESAALRAALPALSQERSEAQIGALLAGRAGAWLDLADLAGAASERDRLLDRAEQDLASETVAGSLIARARLAVARAARSPARSRHWLEALEHDIVERSNTGHGPTEDRRRRARLEAITQVARIDRARARSWLESADDLGADAIRLWLRWGEPARARACVPDDGSLRAAAMLALVDPVEGGRLVDARSDQEPEHLFGRATDTMFWDENLAAIARLLAPTDPERARAIAHRISGQGFGESGVEQIEALAEIAHADLDAGRREAAEAAVVECLAGIDTAPDSGPGLIPQGVPIRIGSGPPTADRHESLFGSSYTTNLHQDWLHRCRKELFLAPVEMARAILPMPFTVGTPYCWERTTRLWAEAIGSIDMAGAEALLGLIGDPGERAIGLAGLETAARQEGDTRAAQRLTAAVDHALAQIPPYDWTFDRAEALAFFNRHKQTLYVAPGHSARGDLEQDSDDALAYVLPDRRAQFEVAVRRAGSEPPADDYLGRTLRAEDLCRESRAMVEATPRGADADPAATAFHRRHVSAESGTDPLARLVRCWLVAGDRILGDRAEWDAAGVRRATRTAPPLSVNDPVDVGLVHVLGVRAGVPAGDQLLTLVDDLLEFLPDRLAAVARLAALAAAATAATDPDGASRLVGKTIEVLRASDDGFARGIGLARLAEQHELDDVMDAGALVDEAATELDGDLGMGKRQVVLSVLFPVMVVRRPGAAAQLLSKSLRSDWREAMAMLEWSAGALVETYGPEAARTCIAALERAQGFRGRDV